MQRYVYCPSEEFLDEANNLAKKVSLSIMVGDNDHSTNLSFDRSKVSVIKIPERQDVFISNSTIKLGFHQSIKYTNEYKVLKNNIELYVNNKKIPSFYEELHVVKFNFLCTEIGEHSCIINISNKKEEEFSFVVD